MTHAEATAFPGRGRPPGLDWLLAPCEPQRFFEDYFEQRILHLAERRADYYKPVFSAAAFEQVVHQGRTGCQLVEQGRKVEAAPGRDLAGRLAAAYRGGATVVIDRVQEAWLPLHRLLRQVEQNLRGAVSANLYLTPERSQGFAAHIDRHDTLILQIEGSKHWRLYQEEPVGAAALAEVRALIADEGTDAAGRWLGEPARELELRSGEALYIPRGVFHEAAAGARASMHVTIGWSPYAWKDLLIDLVEQAAERNPELQRSVPRLGSAGKADGRHHLDSAARGQLADHLAELPRGLDIDELLESRDRLFIHGLERLPIGAFALRPKAVSAKPAFARREGLPCYVWRDEGGCGLGFPGGSLHGPGRLESALRHIAEVDTPFHAADLPGPLADQAKRQLVERLLDDGLLESMG